MLAADGDTRAQYPLKLGKVVFDLKDFIGMKNHIATMTLKRHNEVKGKIKFEISIVPQEQAKDAGIDADDFFNNMQTRDKSMSIVNGMTADHFLKKQDPSKMLAVVDEETKEVLEQNEE